MSDRAQLDSSYRYCRRIARAAARNFYYAIYLLPREKRNALCALYAFMRQADDISDLPGDEHQKQAQMAAWREMLDTALRGEYGDHPAAPALHDAVTRYGIPAKYLHDLITGTEMDLSTRQFADFAALQNYCYHVAGTVGLCCVHVFGFADSRVPELAERLGLAFQLTNILRDVKTDFRMGRIYLPQEDLACFSCRENDLGGARLTPALEQLLRHTGARARAAFDAGRELLPLVARDSQPALWTLIRIYRELLAEIERRGYDVFSGPEIHLPRTAKLAIMLRARLGWWDSEHVIHESYRDRRGTGGTLLGGRAG
jgi:phytoene synthase